LNDTVQFTGVQYKQISLYKEIPSGVYNLAVFTASVNHSLILQSVTFTGGYVYTIYLEGPINELRVDQSVDFVPPSTGFIRFFHASPNTAPVDLLVDGSADYRGVSFQSASAYNSYLEGSHDIRVVPTDQRVPTLVSDKVTIAQDTWSSVLLIGLQNKTENETSSLEAWVIADQHTLPAGGDILIRFIHASPNAPALDIRASGVSLFSGVTFKNLTTYRVLDANIYDIELYETGKPSLLLTSKFDLRVSSGSAIYTLVAEGIYGKDLKVLSFLDNGPTPPSAGSSTTKQPGGLSAVSIGLIVAGVVVAVIALAAGGFVFWRRRQRAGYSEIATSEH